MTELGERKCEVFVCAGAVLLGFGMGVFGIVLCAIRVGIIYPCSDLRLERIGFGWEYSSV